MAILTAMRADLDQPDYGPVISRETKRLSLLISSNLLDRVDEVVRSMPGMTKTQFWQEALKEQLLGWIAQEMPLNMPGGQLVKPAGQRFPARLKNHVGRPSDSDQIGRGQTDEVQVRVPRDLAEHYKDATFWLSAKYATMSYAAEEALEAALKRF